MRVFTAIDIPEDIKDRIERVASQFHVQGITLVKRDQLHITLHFLGEIREDRLSDLKNILDRHRFSRFEASLVGLSHFSPMVMRVIFVDVAKGADKISEIYTTLADSFMQSDLYSRREPYVPHATIARVKHKADGKLLYDLVKKYAAYEFGSFEVNSVSLKKSTLTSSGPVYEVLHKLEF